MNMRASNMALLSLKPMLRAWGYMFSFYKGIN
jgi:hypothetical protein